MVRFWNGEVVEFVRVVFYVNDEFNNGLKKKFVIGVGGIFIFFLFYLLFCVVVDKIGCEEGEDVRDLSIRGVILKCCGELLLMS